MSWPDIVQSVVDFENGLTPEWRCSPLTDQRTAIVLLPVLDTTILGDISGTAVIPIAAAGNGAYLFGLFWIDAERTFKNPRPLGGNWQYVNSSTGQGQAEIQGVFLINHPTALGGPINPGAGVELLDCDPDSSILCFLVLVE